MTGEKTAPEKRDAATRRNTRRFRATGIVAFEDSRKPIVTRLYDIAKNGVSFLHADDWHAAGGVIEMDILVFDVISEKEYFISQVKGQVKSKDLVNDPERKGPTWRSCVEFMELDRSQQNVLESCLGLVSQSRTGWSVEEDYG